MSQNAMRVAAALESADWSGVSIGNKALIAAAIDALMLSACPTPWEWFPMGTAELEMVKINAVRVLLFVPKISVTTGTKNQHTQVYPPKLVMAHWATVPATTAAITPGKHALELQQKHGGYWAADKKGVKPVTGAPSLWAYLPELEFTKSSRPERGPAS